MLRVPSLTWSAALSDIHPDPAKRGDRLRTISRVDFLGRGVHQQMVQKRRIKQGILGIAEGRGGCPFGTERHPLRPWVGRADEHTDPLFSYGKGGRPGPSLEQGPGKGVSATI